MRKIRRLGMDEDGAVLVFVALALAVFLGLVAMSFDMGRLAATQSDLQSFADNMALAVAGELDGKTDALTRAQAARNAMISDTQSFARGGRALDASDVTLTFLSALDADDIPPFADTVVGSPVVGGGVTAFAAADQRRARYVQVSIAPHFVQLGFASAMGALTGGSVGGSNVTATAVAGFRQFACDVTPLMFCLPAEGVSSGQMIRLVAGSGSGAWGPGNFGYLDIRDIETDNSGPCGGLKGANRTRCALGATEHITACYSIDGVDTKTGSSVGIMTDPLNFRFDMYPNSFSTEQASANFAPAPNTIHGFVPTIKNAGKKNESIDWCSRDTSATATTIPLPRDSCFATNSCAHGNRFGNSVWDRAGYITANHNGIDPETNPSNPRTRYQMYQDEIARAGGAASSARLTPEQTLAGLTRYETGRHQCSAHQSSDLERRVVIAAGVNCDPSRGGTEIKGDTDDVPVENFYRIFLTEPVGTTGGSGMYIYGEVIGTAGGAGSTPDGRFRDFVQLYR